MMTTGLVLLTMEVMVAGGADDGAYETDGLGLH